MKKLKILGFLPNEGGCAYYRMIMPLNKLLELYPDKIELKFTKNPLEMDEKTGEMKTDEYAFPEIEWCDVIVTNNISNYGGNYTARTIGIAKKLGKFVHYDTDDLLIDLYDGHRLKGVYLEKGLYDMVKFMYSSADLVTVTQKKFAERIQPYCGGVLAIVKNSIDYNLPCWNSPRHLVKRGKKRITRIGWAAGIHHEEDVKEFTGVPYRVNSKCGVERIQWDFYGSPPREHEPDGTLKWQSQVWETYKKHLLHGFKGQKNWAVHGAMPPDRYGIMIANMDVGIAPLQMNDFNDSKSEIKVGELGRYRVPLIASNVGCYDETIINGETGYLIDPDAPKSEWVKVLSHCIRNPKHVQRMGENLHKITEEFFDINKVVKHRLELYESCFGLLEDRNKEGCTYNREWVANV